MRTVVTIMFASGQSLEIPVDTPDLQDEGVDVGRAWFEDKWVELDCEPARASGKVLLLDRILSVTEALGDRTLTGDADLAQAFALHAALALDKPSITIDLRDQTVGF